MGSIRLALRAGIQQARVATPRRINGTPRKTGKLAPPFKEPPEEPCINGRILGIGGYFQEPNDALAGQLLSEQLEDGGWNCEAPKSCRSSFHTTI